jgi:serine/threonine protein kinase
MSLLSGPIRPGIYISERYRLDRILGSGGTGEVWLAEDVWLDCPCAIKLVHADRAAEQDVRVRLRREARAAARIRCINVVDVFDHGEWLGRPYLVMEYLEGEDLYTRLTRQQLLSPARTYAIIAQVARALSRAHAAGIVHRDLKPENIFLVSGDDQEIAKVVDFGIARLDALGVGDRRTRAGILLGTPGYMSPEQARGDAVDWRSDLWALAVIAFHCMTGKLPFDADSVGQMLAAILHEPVPVPSQCNPQLNEAIDHWWQRASAKERHLRYQTAHELSDGLAEAIGVAVLPVPPLLPRALSSYSAAPSPYLPPLIPTVAGFTALTPTPACGVQTGPSVSPSAPPSQTVAPLSRTRHSVVSAGRQLAFFRRAQWVLGALGFAGLMMAVAYHWNGVGFPEVGEPSVSLENATALQSAGMTRAMPEPGPHAKTRHVGAGTVSTGRVPHPHPVNPPAAKGPGNGSVTPLDELPLVGGKAAARSQRSGEPRESVDGQVQPAGAGSPLSSAANGSVDPIISARYGI